MSVLIWTANQNDVSPRLIRQGTMSLRTFERLHADGKITDAYITPGGHRRVRRPPRHVRESALRLVCEQSLEKLKGALFPYWDELLELICVCAVAENIVAVRQGKWEVIRPGASIEIDSQKIKALCDPRVRLGLKGEILRLSKIEVTPQTLAVILRVSVSTLYDPKHFGRAIVRDVCRQAMKRPVYPAASPETRFDVNPTKYGRQNGDGD